MTDHPPSPPFSHAVASFEPTSTSVLLWTRLSGGAAEARWLVATDASLEVVVASGHASTAADRDHTIVIDVTDLDPATTYWYRFDADGHSSPIGRTRTLPGRGAASFRLATVSCAHYAVAPLGVYRAVADRETDLVLHLGDYIYEDADASGPRPHDPPHTAVTLDDYRRRLAQVRADPDAQAVHLRHPMVTIWDDHDLADNAWRDGAKAHDPDEHGPWSARVTAAARARQEWLPSRLRDPDDPLTTWRSMQIGDLAEVLLLDTRLTGRDQQAGDEESPDLNDPQRSLLGEAQRAWVHERLADTTRPWTIVASGVVVNPLELSWPRPLQSVNALLPNGYAVLDGRVMHDDQWDGYPAERDRLAGWMQERGEHGGRTVLLSGDVHSSWAFRGPIDPASGQAVAVEVTTPAVSSAAMGRMHVPGMWRLLDRAVKQMPHVQWANVTERGYCTIELTPDAVTASWWFVHPYADDPAADAATPSATFRTHRDRWPPDFEQIDDEPLEPPHVEGPEPLPPRPADLGRLRRRRWMRLAAEAAAAATAVVVAVGAIGRRRS